MIIYQRLFDDTLNLVTSLVVHLNDETSTELSDENYFDEFDLEVNINTIWSFEFQWQTIGFCF